MRKVIGFMGKAISKKDMSITALICNCFVITSLFAGMNWTQITDYAEWTPRAGHSSVVFNDTMWVLGGLVTTSKEHFNDVWYSTDGDSWSQATFSAGWSKRYGHSSVVFDNKMWVMGGEKYNDLGFSNCYKDVWYSTDGINWTCATASAGWSKRAIHTSLVFDNKMWIIGGLNDSIMQVYNDVWYSTDGITWICATDSAGWSQRCGHSSTVFDNKMWVMGGTNCGESFDDVWYSDNGTNWTKATSAPGWNARQCFPAVALNNKMWVCGGTDCNLDDYNDVWYSANGIAWTRAMMSAGWSKRNAFTSVIFTGKMWVMGGCSGNAPYSDVWNSATIGVEEPLISDLGMGNAELEIGENPFVKSTIISYFVPPNNDYKNIRLTINDISGRTLKTLVDEEKGAGNYNVNLNAKELKTGVYFLRLTTGTFKTTKKITIIR
ncbi:MAG: T9SS type A sorting domain-containing protein [bacterium]|nr:T9SS type A sorting domain-containing protein [bacterium]